MERGVENAVGDVDDIKIQKYDKRRQYIPEIYCRLFEYRHEKNCVKLSDN